MRFSSSSKARVFFRMTAKQGVWAAIAVSLVLTLGACSPFSGYVADGWPHWAGGEPTGLPPRPGSPGYAEYIAHGQPVQNPDAAAGAAPAPPAVETTQTVSQTAAGTAQKASIFGGPKVAAPQPNVQAPPPVDATNDDVSTVRGGLY